MSKIVSSFLYCLKNNTTSASFFSTKSDSMLIAYISYLLCVKVSTNGCGLSI